MDESLSVQAFKKCKNCVRHKRCEKMEMPFYHPESSICRFKPSRFKPYKALDPFYGVKLEKKV